MIKPYEGAINLLNTIPEVKRASTITIISEIGTDMSNLTTPNVYAATDISVAKTKA